MLKTLVFGGGTIHDWKGVTTAAEKALREAGGFEITKVEEDLNCLAAPNLDPYELIVFHYTLGELTDAQKNGLLNWVAKGNGYVGIHSAADSFRECPEYRALVGGYFLTHPRYRQYMISLAEVDHEVSNGLEEREFNVTDEQYITDYDPRNLVLASALWKGQAMPVAWVKPWGKGRVFYLALGHDAKACEHLLFHTLLARGAKWAGTKSGE